MGFWRLEGKAPSLHGSARDPLPSLWELAWCFVGLPTVAVAMSLILLPVLETLYLLFFALFSLRMEAFALSIVSCFVLSGSCLLEACSFLKRRQRGSGCGGQGRWRGLARVEGGKLLW